MELRNNYKKLGDYIREIDVRNKGLRVTRLLGVSNEKYFIPSIANIVGTDLSNYKIVKRNQFAFGTVTSRNGDKLSIAILKEDECIVSSSYVVFEVIDESKLNPDYLMMWLRREEFDRYARFMSHGSVRELFGWDKLCDVELPIPDIGEQLKYVNDYESIQNAIKIKEAINNNLLESLDTKLNILMSENDLENHKFGDFAMFLNGYAFKSDSYLNNGKYKILTIGNVQDGKIDYSNCNYLNELPKNIPNHCILDVGDILMSLTGYVGRIAIVDQSDCLLNQRVCKIKPLKQEYLSGIIALMRCTKVQQSMNKMSDGGTAQQNLSAIELSNTSFEFVNIKAFESFCNDNNNLISFYMNNLAIINNLVKIQRNIISSIAQQ